MPNLDDRLSQVRPKLERAKHHVTSLEAEVKRFLETTPYKVGTTYDPHTRRLTYSVIAVEPVPELISLIAGEAVQCFVTTLDHLAYQLVLADTGGNPSNPGRICFPIADDAAKYRTRIREGMDGANQATVDAIDALKPYREGNDLLWKLSRLNNIEKHRHLMTVGSVFGGVNMGAVMSSLWQKRWDARTPPQRAPKIPDVFIREVNVPFPLQVGQQLYTDAPDAEHNDKLSFMFQVALYEPPIIDAESILALMYQFREMVEGIVTGLSPRLA